MNEFKKHLEKLKKENNIRFDEQLNEFHRLGNYELTGERLSKQTRRASGLDKAISMESVLLLSKFFKLNRIQTNEIIAIAQNCKIGIKLKKIGTKKSPTNIVDNYILNNDDRYIYIIREKMLDFFEYIVSKYNGNDPVNSFMEKEKLSSQYLHRHLDEFCSYISNCTLTLHKRDCMNDYLTQYMSSYYRDLNEWIPSVLDGLVFSELPVMDLETILLMNYSMDNSSPDPQAFIEKINKFKTALNLKNNLVAYLDLAFSMGMNSNQIKEMFQLAEIEYHNDSVFEKTNDALLIKEVLERIELLNPTLLATGSWKDVDEEDIKDDLDKVVYDAGSYGDIFNYIFSKQNQPKSELLKYWR